MINLENNLPSAIMSAIDYDHDKDSAGDSKEMIRLYKTSDNLSRNRIDRLFIAMCGRSFKSFLAVTEAD